MEHLKVLHIHFGKEGGAERFFVALSQAFSQRGIEQRFIVRPNRTWSADIAALGPVIEGNFSHFIAATGVMQYRIRKLCRRWEPDAIMAWMPRASRLIPDYPKAVRITRLGDFPLKLRYFGNTDVIVGNLPAIADQVRELGWTKETRTISNFPRPVAVQPVSRADHDTPDDVFLVVAGGRFVPRKGLDATIRAVARVPGAWLWLLGEGEEKENLRALVADLGVGDRVKFIGWVPEAIHHIAAADAFMMPSRHEPLGNMLLEAWRAGVPSVSTRSEGPDWYMRPEVDGILTEIDDIDALAAGLIAIRDNPEQGRAYVENAKARLDEMFSVDAVVSAYADLFRNGPREVQS
ncbi:hypothetical protein B6V74_04995 [Thioclava sp. F42-5]|uniref:glycosyltransferase n=1 Tax=Thioclava sp. F42-5 TaxID=1973005 RepID=UPI000B546562|nr:glycosyltransferase [Thioclava sp. F42-5]OWY11363.1 hypothetical protein B6V74_04995 [Thioclava sp. F42-5]